MACLLRTGMSMFSTKGGLYERAQRRFKVQDGKKLFTYSFYEKQKLEAMVRLPASNLMTSTCSDFVLELPCRISGLQISHASSTQLRHLAVIAA